jgi:hypothetical protein
MRLGSWYQVVCMAFIAVLSGCGTPGAPQLPSLQLARPVEDLTASRKGTHVQLDWTLPRKNTDRTLVKNIPEVRICRHNGSALMSSCPEVAKVAPPQQPPGKKKKGEAEPKAIHMQYGDALPEQLGEQNPAGFVTYAVELMNVHGRSAGLSNQVVIPVAPTLPPPDDLSAEVSADGVRIAWRGPEPPSAPPGLTYEYRIMRKPAGAPAYIAVSEVAPEARGSFLDKTFAWEQKYDYRITTVTSVHVRGINSSVEGEDSKPVEVFTKDIYPPAQPTGLQAVFSSIGQKPFIDLTWAPNSDDDLAGYNVFRRSDGSAPEKLNRQPLPVPSFRDQNIEAGKRYVYSVSAVDLRGNESPRSQDAEETVPNQH